MSEEKRDVRFLDPASGQSMLSFGAVTLLDAAGKTLSAAVSVRDGRLAIRIPRAWVARAQFPILVDLLIGPNFAVSSDARPEQAPAIAHDSVNDRWLAVYEVKAGGANFDVFGQVLNSHPIPKRSYSMDLERSDLRRILQQVIMCMVHKDYEKLEAITHGLRLSARDVRSALESYGRTLVAPPEECLDGMDVRRVRGAEPPSFSVWCSLWTAEEGRSDLTVQLTITGSRDSFTVELDDLHVL